MYASSLIRWRVAAAILVALIGTRAARAQYDFEGAPINYATAPTDQPVSQLIERLSRDGASLKREGRQGILKALLEAWEIPVSSQVLVFTKTSFQSERISPKTPRALYFSDDVYVGWVQGSQLLEVTAYDPQLGPIFYTVDQAGFDKPEFLRQNHECTQCHASSLTHGAPGHIVRSVYSDISGHPILRNGSFLTDHRSPLKERWGGWYVTGRHGQLRHLGNQWFSEVVKVEELNREPGANITSLDDRIDTSRYLTPHSDIVALMVLEHQTTVQNQLAQAVYQTRYALRDADAMNQALDRPADFQSESTQRRINNAAEALLKVILLDGEAALGDKIEGTSGFAQEFSQRGPRDAQGRSLRELDLERRLFKYPCSYLIYSRGVMEMPAALKSVFFARLWATLDGSPATDDLQGLSIADRQAIREILRETLPAELLAQQ
ncbi:MAG: hypothetical protein SGJ19_14475 [Planctomycetia bacterium]|nr:hypothetical protein [Planctomycetia bacterium]